MFVGVVGGRGVVLYWVEAWVHWGVLGTWYSLAN